MSDKEFKQRLIIALAESGLPLADISISMQIKIHEVLIGIADKVCDKLNASEVIDKL